MAVLFIDSFDQLGSGQNIVNVGGKWQDGGWNQPATTNTRARTGPCSISFGGNYSILTRYVTPSGGGFFGCAVYPVNPWGQTTATELFQVRENAIIHLAVAVSNLGVVSVKRGSGGTTLATSLVNLPTNGWLHMEFGFTIGASGSFEFRVDGVADPQLTVSGVNTQNGGTGAWNAIYIGGQTGGTNIDDFYLCDSSGPAPRNTFLGPLKMEVLMAQTGNGSNVGLTPSTGTDHGALVDEQPPNTTDYNSSNSIGTKDTYNLSNPTLVGEVICIQSNLYVAKSDAGARKICPVLRHGGADYDGADKALSTTFQYVVEVHPTRPAGAGGGDWTTADLTALEAGMKVTL